MNILFLSRWFPYPTNNGSKLRIYNLLRGLGQHHAVTLLSFADQPDVSPEVPEVQSICSEVHVVPWKEFDPHSLRARLGFFSLKPRSIIDTFSSEMAQEITDLLGHQKYDLLIASQLQMAAYAPYFGNVPALFEELEIGLSYEDMLRASDWKRRLRHAFTWFKLRRYLSQLLQAFRVVTVVSEQEKELVRQHFPRLQDVLVIPNCMNMDDYENVRAEPKPNTLIFTGSFRYHTNYEAMLWFVGNVFPLVLQKVPDANLIITGDHANLPLPSMRNVTLAGYVDDIKSLIASCTVALAPLWSGGGTRLKILEAMAIGTPVVATSKGAEGLDAKPGKHLFVADEPEKFAEAVVQILSEPEVRQRLAASGNELVRAKYDWGGVMPEFLRRAAQISGL
jgi:glycosyltransferase involved in cell wall biosynthesis